MSGIRFTKHAEKSMAKRNISKEQVVDAVRNPDQVFMDLSTKSLIAVKIRENLRAQIVAYRVEDEEIVVITTFITSKLNKLVGSKVSRGAWVRIS